MVTMKTLFGPSKKEIWRQLSAEIGAKYVEGPFWKGDKVQATHGAWTVTLDTYAVSNGKTTVIYTRMRAPFVNPAGFRFTIHRKNLFTDIAKWFGMQDMEVGHEPFDRDFVIKGTDQGMLRALFSNPKVRDLIEKQKDIHFTVKDDEGWFGATFPEGVDELYFSVVGVIKDVERLKLLYELFSETLEQLCMIGSAQKINPGVSV
jgi:hypothetical protein